jgi:hypothetical protein
VDVWNDGEVEDLWFKDLVPEVSIPCVPVLAWTRLRPRPQPDRMIYTLNVIVRTMWTR